MDAACYEAAVVSLLSVPLHSSRPQMLSLLSLERTLPFVTCSSHTDKHNCLWTDIHCMSCVSGVMRRTSVHSCCPLSLMGSVLSDSLTLYIAMSIFFSLMMQVDFINWQTWYSRCLARLVTVNRCMWHCMLMQDKQEETLSVEKEEPLCNRRFFPRHAVGIFSGKAALEVRICTIK